MRAPLRLCAPILVLLAGPGSSQEGPGPAEQESLQHAAGLTEAQTSSLVVTYERSRHWALRGFVLLALGERWHPLGAEIVLDALSSSDRALRVYGLECLLRTDPAALRTVVTAELAAELAKVQVREKHEDYSARVEQLLGRLFPGEEAEGPAAWARVWRGAASDWELEPWVSPPPPKGDGRTSAMGSVERALDLHEGGLDLCICMDATGSMQPTIDAVRDSIDDLVLLLAGIAPDFRLGLVEYRDHVDYSAGARVLEELTPSPLKVKKKLARLQASGGGDFPEAVVAGLTAAYGSKVKWRRSANKLVVLFGDAPPHSADEAVELARSALERPFGLDPTDLTKKSRRTRTVVRPFVTSAVAVGGEGVHGGTERAFMRLAQAGGGAYTSLLTETDPGTEDPSEAIARHVLTLAFGVRWREQVELFIGIYTRSHRNGFLR